MIDGDSSRKVTEKSELARKEFFKKIDKLAKQGAKNPKMMQAIADQAAQEYNKLFGRVGVHPLMHLKGGKKPLRYLLERDELWVLYKPPLWQMGGNQAAWSRTVQELVTEHRSLDK